MKLNKDYWEQRYLKQETGWDIGYPSKPLCDYFDQLNDKSIKILVPGAGNAYEVEYLYKKGFSNVYLLDIAFAPIENFLKRVPEFPVSQILQENFFEHTGKYDLIAEQTFFTSIPRNLRRNYAKQIYNLLKDEGKFVGLFFNHEFNKQQPPFGGSSEEYKKLFSPCFYFNYFETAYNSISPRQGRELFIHLHKKLSAPA